MHGLLLVTGTVIFAAAKSKTALYVVGSVLVLWAVVVSWLGIRDPDFPGKVGGERTVMAISGVLVVATIGSAIATANREEGEKTATVAIAAEPHGQLAFTETRVLTPAGRVTFNFTNVSPVQHNFTLYRGGSAIGSTPTFNGGTKSFAVDLKPGVYRFACSVTGHDQAGMHGVLVVQ
jgi:plastocyanin